MAQVWQSQEQTKWKEPVLDPIAYRTEVQWPVTEESKNWWWEPQNLKNADINLSAYWDDSSSANYNNPDLWWWENQKYTGENTKNTTVQYNPDATVSWLNPNYAFWRKAQMVNSWDAWYIQRRNDEIASALYNEWITDVEAVRNYLMQQQWFMDSEANERENTTQSVWKRIGQIGEQQKKPEQEEQKPFAEDTLVKDTSWKLYGKDTADTWEPLQWIDTLADANSIYRKMEEARIGNVNALRSMDPSQAAALTYSWTTPYGETAMRDLQSLDPEWYAQYKQSLQKLYTQDAMDDISHWAAPDEETKTFIDTTDETIDNDIKTFEENNTSDETHEWAWWILNNLLKSNKVATSAKQEMLNIKKDIADLNTQLEELPNEANKLFKWDVPQYLVQAYISNNSQKIQSKIKNLENRYSSLSDMYKTEVSQAQREAEYQLKMAEYNRALTNDAYDREYKNNKLLQDSVQRVNWVPYSFDANTKSFMKLDDNTALFQYNSKVSIQSQWWQSLVWKKTWLECEWYTDMQSNATAWVTMVWASGWATTAAEKVAYATNWWYIDKDWNIVYWNSNISDLIPQIWDIGVMISNWSNWVSEKRWHTVYVDSVRTENWETMIHYTATNLGSTPDKYTVWYDRTVSLTDFMNNGWVWFWNPYKQAQYNWQPQQEVWWENPMELVVDERINSWKLNATQLTNLSAFWRTYENLWRSKNNWELYNLLNEHEAARFLQELSVSLTNPNSWQSINSSVESLWKITLDEFMKQMEIRAAQEFGWWSQAYMWFMAIVWVVESKLRKESGAAISWSEWALDFLQYLPQAWDTEYTMNRKLENLETFLKYWAKEWGITKDQYIPLNLWTVSKERDYE